MLKVVENVLDSKATWVLKFDGKPQPNIEHRWLSLTQNLWKSRDAKLIWKDFIYAFLI